VGLNVGSKRNRNKGKRSPKQDGRGENRDEWYKKPVGMVTLTVIGGVILWLLTVVLPSHLSSQEEEASAREVTAEVLEPETAPHTAKPRLPHAQRITEEASSPRPPRVGAGVEGSTDSVISNSVIRNMDKGIDGSGSTRLTVDRVWVGRDEPEATEPEPKAE
jgi:hypothetical protein